MISTAELPEDQAAAAAAEARLERARKALRRKQKNGPRLLLEAVDYRIRELEPDCADLWAAARRIAKARGKIGIEAGYWGVMLFKQDADREGYYHKDDAELLYETAEIVLRMLGPEQGGSVSF